MEIIDEKVAGKMENKGFISNLLCRFATADENNIACSIYDGNRLTDITYHQFLHDILKVAGYFADRKICNQHIALVAPNSYRWIITFYGIMASGNVAVLLNPALPVEMVASQCMQADAAVLCCESDASEDFQSVSASMELLCLEDIKSETVLSIEQVYQADADETIAMLGTSGTTGKSKIVEITSKNMHSGLQNTNHAASVDGLERSLLILPLFHIGGAISTSVVFNRLRTLCIGRGPTNLLADMGALNPTFVPFVPAMMESVVKILRRYTDLSDRAKYIGNNLQRIHVAGAAPNLATCQYLISQGIAIETGYGMTEATGSVTWGELDTDNIGTIGKVHGDLIVRFQDGELQVKGDAVMKGYYKDPEETAKVIEDGWLRTGDLGYCDENGYYYITGRKKNVIILSNGENINPEEIEAKWCNCEHILECMVYSDGKGICADVYIKDPEAAAIFIKEYNSEMPMYHHVYKVNYFYEPLEKTSTGKIKRKENR